MSHETKEIIQHLNPEPDYTSFLDKIAETAENADKRDWETVDQAVDHFDDHQIKDSKTLIENLHDLMDHAAGEVRDAAYTVLSRVDTPEIEGLEQELYSEVVESVGEGLEDDHDPAAFRASIASVVHNFHEEDLDHRIKDIYDNIADFASQEPEFYREAVGDMFERIDYDLDVNPEAEGFIEHSKDTLKNILSLDYES